MKNKERLIGVIMAVIISVAMGALFTFLSRRNWTPEQAKMMPPAVPAMKATKPMQIIKSVSATTELF